MKSIWFRLYESIGIKLIVKTVWQMTADGMHKVEEIAREYFGPLAHAGAMGRPVLTPDYLQSHTVGVAGTKDVIWNPLYDFISYPSAGQLLFSFFANQIGQGVSSTPGAGAVAKSVYDTNLTISNQLTLGNEFYAIGSESLFYPGVSNANLPLALMPAKQNTVATATSIGQFINDMWSVGNGGFKTLSIGTDRKYIQDGPLFMFPPCTRLAAAVAIGSGGVTTASEVTYAAWSGEPYTIVPIYLAANQSFTMTVAFNTLIPTVSTQTARLGERLRGYLIRQAT